MDETAARPKKMGWFGVTVACALAGMSMSIAITHFTSGWINPAEAIVMGPTVAGWGLVGVIDQAVNASLPFYLLCMGVVSILGWYALLVWLFMPERRSRLSQKIFWAVLGLLTWLPAIILCIVTASGYPVGSGA